MKQHEIEVGGRYYAAVSGRRVAVRVDKIEISQVTGLRRYHVINEATRRTLVFRSARRFQARLGEPKRVEAQGPDDRPGPKSLQALFRVF